MMNKRPNCQVSGCNNGAQNTGNKRKDGSIGYRKSKGFWICGTHHRKGIAKKHGFDSYEKAFPNERLQEAIDAGYSTRIEYNKAMHLEKIQKQGFTDINEYKEQQQKQYSATAAKKKYVSWESFIKYKAAIYFRNDKKAGKDNGYSSADEMAKKLIKKVHENIKENLGVLRSEVTQLILNHNKNDMLQLSFDRIDNDLGHSAENVQLVEEPVNTMRKDKFTIDQTQEWIVAAAKSLGRVA